MSESNGESLYDWFDSATRKDGREMTKYSACSAVIQNVGLLMGLGLSEAEVADFLDRLVRTNAVLLRRVSDEKSLGENLDAMLAPPVLVALEGGKEAGKPGSSEAQKEQGSQGSQGSQADGEGS